MAWERVRKSGQGRGERTRARGDDDSLWARWGTGSSARAPPSSVEALTSRFTAMTLLISPCARKFESGGEGVSPVIETATTRVRGETVGAGGVFKPLAMGANREMARTARAGRDGAYPGSSANGHLARLK